MQSVVEVWRRLEAFLTSGIAGSEFTPAQAADRHRADLGAGLDDTACDAVADRPCAGAPRLRYWDA